jgi:hypothetical protein
VAVRGCKESRRGQADGGAADFPDASATTVKAWSHAEVSFMMLAAGAYQQQKVKWMRSCAIIEFIDVDTPACSNRLTCAHVGAKVQKLHVAVAALLSHIINH